MARPIAKTLRQTPSESIFRYSKNHGKLVPPVSRATLDGGGGVCFFFVSIGITESIMAEETGIAWAGDAERKGATWSAWLGCAKITERRSAWAALGSACDHCYAEMNAEPKRRGRAEKAGQTPVPLWGKAGVRQQCASTWTAPLRWNRKAERAARRLRVFVSSMSDIFETHASINEEWRTHAFGLVEQCGWLDFLLLTKRPGSITHHLRDRTWLSQWPENCWLGATVEHAGNLRRIEELLAVPGAPPVRFLSCEPLLGPLDLRPYLGADRINWVIVGGESGSGARRTDPDWIRDIRDQCAKAGVAFFYKQPGDVEARKADLRFIHDPDDHESRREMWLLDGKPHWNWPATSVSPAAPKGRGRPSNAALGLPPALDDNARQARRRSMSRHKTDGGWDRLITQWLDPLPLDQRKEAAEALRHAITKSLKKS